MFTRLLTVWITMLISLKYLSTSQVDVPNSAVGRPHPDGSGFLDKMSAGMLCLGQCQTLMASSVHSSAYTPPPTALKGSPYVCVSEVGGT